MSLPNYEGLTTVQNLLRKIWKALDVLKSKVLSNTLQWTEFDTVDGQSSYTVSDLSNSTKSDIAVLHYGENIGNLDKSKYSLSGTTLTFDTFTPSQAVRVVILYTQS